MAQQQKDSTVSDLNEAFDRAREIKRPLEGQWVLNHCYFRGRQWLAWDGRQIYRPDLHEGAETPVDNRIRGIVRKEIAKLTRNRPEWDCTPMGPGAELIAAARLSELIADAKWDALDMTRKLRRALNWSRICSAGFIKVFADNTLGDKITVLAGADGEVLYDQHGRPMTPDMIDGMAEVLPPEQAESLQNLKRKQMATGDVAAEVRSCFAMFVDELAGEDGMAAAGWAGEEVVRSPAYVLERYDEELEPDASLAPGAAEARMPGWGRSEAKKTGVRLRERWDKPSSDFPNGKRIVWAPGDEKVLYEDDNPYPWLPYVMFGGIPVPDSFWPDAMVTDLISPQTRRNKRLAQIDENAGRFGNPPLTYPKGTDIEWYGLPGEHLQFDDTGSPNAAPRFLDVPEIPAYIQQDNNDIESAFMEISHQHEVTSGRVPAGVTAASAINLLLEQDDTVLGPDSEDMDIALGELGSKVLEIVASVYSTPRVLQLTGEDAQLDIVNFRGAMLRGHTKVSVKTGSGLARSKAARQAAMSETLQLLIQYGVQLEQRDLRRFFKDYEVGGLDRLFASMSADEQQVNREHTRLVGGEELPINDFDDHQFHLAGHNEFRKSVRYEQLDESARARVDTHVDLHVEKLTALAAPPVDPAAAGANGAQQQGGAIPPELAAAIGGGPAPPAA